MIGFFIGAGASVDFGFPLTSDFTKVITKNILSRLDTKLYNFRDREKSKEKFVSILQDKSLNYEQMIGAIETWRKKEYTNYQDISVILKQTIECVHLLLLGIQKISLPQMNARFTSYVNLQYLLQKQNVVEIFSLNHDLVIEELCCFHSIKFKDGFYENRRHGYHNLNNFKSISKEELEAQDFNFLNDTERGINLLKLHGSLDIFAANDKEVYLKTGGNNHFSSLTKAVLDIEDQALLQAEKNNIRGVNELIILDENSEIQFLRRSLLTGSNKFKNTVQQIAPVSLFKEFKTRIQKISELVVVGYSFGDAHINDVILNWIQEKNKTITICDPHRASIPDFLQNFSNKISVERIDMKSYLLRYDKQH